MERDSANEFFNRLACYAILENLGSQALIQRSLDSIRNLLEQKKSMKLDRSLEIFLEAELSLMLDKMAKKEKIDKPVKQVKKKPK